MLKIGPAIVPVIAISPKPFFVIATSALISPKQLPQASIVSPNKALGSFVINPNNYNISMILLEVKLIQTILIKKQMKAYMVKSKVGA